MRLVADSQDEYKQLVRIQRVITGLWKMEKEDNPESTLIDAYKKIMNTPIEKSYEMPGQGVKIANNTKFDTTDRSLIVPYIVQAAITRKKCAIEYQDAKGNISKRLIEPHTWRNNQVVAWCHERGAWRQFKPAQIQRIAITDEAYDRDEVVEIVAEHAKDYAGLA